MSLGFRMRQAAGAGPQVSFSPVFSFSFSESDGATTVANAGSGGAVAGELFGGGAGAHVVTNEHGNPANALILTNDCCYVAAANMAQAFFAGDYRISFDVRFSNGDVIAGGGDAFLQLLDLYPADGARELHWFMSAVESGGAFDLVFGLNSFEGASTGLKRFTASGITGGAYTPVVITNIAGNATVSVGGTPATRTTNDAVVIPATAVSETVLLWASQLDLLWNGPAGKMFIDNFTVEVGA